MVDFSNLYVDRLIADCGRIDYSHQISIDCYYREFLWFFNNKETISYNDIVVASHMVYGWMPTMLRLNTSEIRAVLEVLNKVKNGYTASLKELTQIRGMMNNSMVGPSKLLHFINPETYAIWDSRIYRYIFGSIQQNQIAKAENYKAYLDEIRNLTQTQEYLQVHDFVQQRMEVSYSKLRTAELVMFETDKLNGNRVT